MQITNQMITACKSYITDSGYETIWTQEQNAVLKKLDDCIKLNEEYQVKTLEYYDMTSLQKAVACALSTSNQK